LPALPGAQGAAHVPPVAAPVQARDGEQAPKAGCVVTRVGRWSIDCAVHGRVRVDELSYPLVCPRRGEGV
jgi:hypothetical protein